MDANEDDVDVGVHDGDESGRSPTPTSKASAKKRPPGRKQEKEKLKRGGDGAVFQGAVQEMILTKKKMEGERNNKKEARWMEVRSIEERKVSYGERKVAIEKEKLRVIF